MRRARLASIAASVLMLFGILVGSARAGEGSSAAFALYLGPGYTLPGGPGSGGVGVGSSGAFAVYLGPGYTLPGGPGSGGVGAGASGVFAMYLGQLSEGYGLSARSVVDTRAADPAFVAGPTGLSATSIACTDLIQMQWTDNAADETGYEVEAKLTILDDSYFAVVSSLPANATSTQHRAPTGLSISYRVRALRGLARSAYSNAGPLTITIGSMPASQRVYAKSMGDRHSIRVHVRPPVGWESWGGIRDVLVLRRPNNGSTAPDGSRLAAIQSDGREAWAEFGDCQEGQPYVFDVRFIDKCSITHLAGVSGVASAVRAPVMFVHGWTGAADNWTDWDVYFQTNRQFMTYAHQFRCVTDKWEAWAQLLDLEVRRRLSASGEWASHEFVDIVAHSQGGLASRSMIEESSKRPLVRKLVMLGTPNHGANFARVQKFFPSFHPLAECTRSGQAKGSEDVRDTSPRLARLNFENEKTKDGACADGPMEASIVNRRKGVRYYTVAGTGSDNQCVLGASLLCVVRSTALRDACSGDGLVDWKGVRLRALDQEGGRCRQWFDTDLGSYGVGLLSHDQPTRLSNAGVGHAVTTAMLESAPLRRFVADLLDAEDESVLPVGTLCPPSPPVAGNALLAGPSSTPEFAAVFEDTITVGAERRHSVHVDPGTRVTILSGWQNGPLIMSLEGPDAHRYEPSDTLVFAWLRYERDDALGYAAYRLDNAAPGEWTAIVAGAPGPDPVFQTQSWVVEGGDRSLSVVVDANDPAPGDSVRITARLSSPTNALLAAVSAEVRTPLGEATSIQFNDSGESGDAVAGDLLYSARYIIPHMDGTIAFRVSASDSANGVAHAPLTHDTTLAVYHRPDPSLRAGDVSWAPVETSVGRLSEIRVLVRNPSRVDAESVAVVIHDLSTDDLVAVLYVPVLAGDSTHVAALWHPTSPGEHSIEAVLETASGLDADVSNNRALVTVPVVSSGGGPIVGVEPPAGVTRFEFSSPFPNPFRDRLNMAFAVPHATHVRLEVFDLAGRRVRTISDEWLTAGSFTRTWDGRDREGNAAHSGVYFVRFLSPDYTLTRRVVTIR